MGDLLTIGAEGAFVAMMLAAAFIDGCSFRLPNPLTAGVALAFLPWALGRFDDPWLLLAHLAAGLVIMAVAALAFARNILGGGDAKLLAACALWTGFDELSRFLVTTSLAGGVLALAVLCLRPAGESRRLPYGIAIAAGGLDFWLRNSAVL
ncbi:Flp pilus assembly protein, protease CpaA [Magnetospirillum sp. LM-5]|uniref:A24 family peptidase n=1 Tax=Magnetospirillum sp. LM-5 TaxID=2681466 RepID=UPI001385551A|nr:prepilin peptidase [Magnetospirillum sp. LM-5]CAA7623948.1 Flp pilus assembly protein, protease CpaA [Magnetospirillum sp. LM-5]